MSLKLVTGPTIEPITTNDAKKQLEIADGDTSHDTHVDRLITGARRDVERITRRALITQTWRRTFDGFPPGKILLPRPPLISVSSVQYYDSDGASQSLSGSLYQVDTESAPGSVSQAINEVWPVTQIGKVNSVTITWTAGFGASRDSVPEEYKEIIRGLVAFRFWSRGDLDAKIPDHIMWALQSLRCGAHSGYYGLID